MGNKTSKGKPNTISDAAALSALANIQNSTVKPTQGNVKSKAVAVKETKLPRKKSGKINRTKEECLGKFKCYGSLVVADPACEINDTPVEGQLLLDRARTGNWDAFCRRRQKDGKVKVIYAIHSDFTQVLNAEYADTHFGRPRVYKKATEVDEESIGIFDFSTYDNDAPYINGDGCNAQGAFVVAGYGRGMYNVVTYSYAGKVVYVKVILVTRRMSVVRRANEELRQQKRELQSPEVSSNSSVSTDSNDETSDETPTTDPIVTETQQVTVAAEVPTEAPVPTSVVSSQ